MRHLRLLLAALLLTTGLAAHADGNPRVRVETSMGKFVIELDSERAPLTVANFLEYVRGGFYSGTIFHRVINNFIAQTGGFDEKYVEKKARPPIPNESGNGLSNRRGTVGLARTADLTSEQVVFRIIGPQALAKAQAAGVAVNRKAIACQAWMRCAPALRATRGFHSRIF